MANYTRKLTPGQLLPDHLKRGISVNKAMQIASELLAAVGGKANVMGNDICMTRLRIMTDNPSLVDTEQLSATNGVLGIVKRGDNGIEVVFGPGKVDDVHEALVDLTGIDSEGGFEGEKEVDPTMRIQISKSAPASTRATVAPDVPDLDDAEELEKVRKLVDLLDAKADDEGSELEHDHATGVLVINGPNINMLGIREPKIYGSENYQALLQLCKDSALEAGFERCSCYQSNHEGDLVDAIQAAYGKYDGIIINPGAYTHTSIAILDAAKAVGLPIVEVHISKVEEREEFRQVSYIRAACFETITGMGIAGYRKAIFDLAKKIGI